MRLRIISQIEEIRMHFQKVAKPTHMLGWWFGLFAQLHSKMTPAKLQFFAKAIEIALGLAKPLKWLTHCAAIY